MNLVTVTKHQNIALEEIKKALPQRIAAVVAIHGNHAHIASNDTRVKKIKWSEGSVKFAEGECDQIMRYLLRADTIYSSTKS